MADPSVEIQFGPNIKDWPEMSALPENLIVKVVSEIHDPVTTTDELIPSGETSSYRSNLINWGMLPFLTDADHEHLPFKNGDYIFVPDVRKAVEEKADVIKAYVVGDDLKEIDLRLGDLTDAERQIILDGCLINYYKSEM